MSAMHPATVDATAPFASVAGRHSVIGQVRAQQ